MTTRPLSARLALLYWFCSTNDLRVGNAVSANKNVRTPASFYDVLGVQVRPGNVFKSPPSRR
jgi:hypothetical protein